MKRIIVIVLGLMFLALFSTSCKKWRCSCRATGYVSESTLDAALDEHIRDCVSIAKNGPIYDYYYDVQISCSY